MAGNYLGISEVQAGEFRTLCRNELVARAVETVTADAVFVIVLIRKGVHVGISRHGMVERGVENSNLR